MIELYIKYVIADKKVSIKKKIKIKRVKQRFRMHLLVSKLRPLVFKSSDLYQLNMVELVPP